MAVQNKTLRAGHPFLDFRIFLMAIWDFQDLPEPTPVQLDIAYSLQNGTDREVLEAFRGVGKSWITCAYVCWCLLLDPDYKIEIISAGEGLAIENATFIHQLINNVPFLVHLKASSHQRNSKLSFDVGPARSNRDPSVKAVGILGQITGTRADLIIADDIEIPKNSDSQTQRDKIRQLITEFESILKPEGGRIQYLGTPQLSDTLYVNLPENYVVRVYPAEYPSQKRLEADTGTLARFITDGILSGESRSGEPVEPTRFTASVLSEKRLGMGVSNYELQFMLNTDASDALRYPLKLRDLIVMDVDMDEGSEKVYYASSTEQELKGENVVGMRGDRYYAPLKIHHSMAKWERKVLAIDPSGRGKDETSYCVLKQLNGQLFLVEWGGLRGGYGEEALQALADLAEKHSITDCIVEDNFGDGMFRQLFQPYLEKLTAGKCLAEGITNTRQKELRVIDTLEPIMNQHKLIVDRKLIQRDWDSVSEYSVETAYRYRGFYQMTHITRERQSLGKDDRIDVLQIGAGYLIDYMNMNQEETIKNTAHTAQMDEHKFWVAANGFSSAKKAQNIAPNWINY